jgi:hypothetical protein
MLQMHLFIFHHLSLTRKIIKRQSCIKLRQVLVSNSKTKKLDFCDDIEVQYHSEFVEDILQEFLTYKSTMHVMMMLTIDESYAYLDKPEGKRRLG